LYEIDSKVEIGCEELCICDVSGEMLCKPRCAKLTAILDKCVRVKNATDACCEIEFCDVTLDDHEQPGMMTLAPMMEKGDKDSKSNEADVEDSHCMYKGKKYKIGKSEN
jgi:hypothetical protein